MLNNTSAKQKQSPQTLWNPLLVYMIILQSSFVLTGDNVVSIQNQWMPGCRQLLRGKLNTIIYSNLLWFASEFSFLIQPVMGRYCSAEERHLFNQCYWNKLTLFNMSLSLRSSSIAFLSSSACFFEASTSKSPERKIINKYRVNLRKYLPKPKWYKTTLYVYL